MERVSRRWGRNHEIDFCPAAPARGVTPHRSRIAIALIASASFAVACGGDDDTADESVVTTAETAATTAETTATTATPEETTAETAATTAETAPPTTEDSSADWDSWVVEAANQEGAVVLYMSIPGYGGEDQGVPGPRRIPTSS